MNQNQSKKILALDSLRFIFVLFIAISHMEFVVKGTYSWNFYYYWQNPLPAIDFFFMLSGFGLTLSSVKNPNRLPEKRGIKALYSYGFKRMRKLFSLYLITMGIAVPIVVLQRVFFGESIKKILVMILANIVLAPTMTQSLFGATVISHGLNSVAWFFSCLFILYCVFPLLYDFNEKIRHNKGMCLAMTGLFLILSEVVYFLFFWVDKNCTMFGLSMDISHCSPFYRILQFAIGIFLADLYMLRDERTLAGLWATVLEIIALLVAILSTLLGNRIMTGYHPFIKNMIYLLAITFLIYVFAFCRGWISKLLSMRVFVELGSISQYIFLIHNLFIMLVDVVVYHYIEANSQINQIFVIIILVMTLISSFLINKIYKSRT